MNGMESPRNQCLCIKCGPNKINELLINTKHHIIPPQETGSSDANSIISSKGPAFKIQKITPNQSPLGQIPLQLGPSFKLITCKKKNQRNYNTTQLSESHVNFLIFQVINGQRWPPIRVQFGSFPTDEFISAGIRDFSDACHHRIRAPFSVDQLL